MQEECFKIKKTSIKNPGSLRITLLGQKTDEAENRSSRRELYKNNNNGPLFQQTKNGKWLEKNRQQYRLHSRMASKEKIIKRFELLSCEQKSLRCPEKFSTVVKQSEALQIGRISTLMKNYERMQKQLEENMSQYELELENAKGQMSKLGIKIQEISRNNRFKANNDNWCCLNSDQIRDTEYTQQKTPIRKKVFLNSREKQQDSAVKESLHKFEVLNLHQARKQQVGQEKTSKIKRSIRQLKKENKQNICYTHPQYYLSQPQVRKTQDIDMKIEKEKEGLPKIKRQRTVQSSQHTNQVTIQNMKAAKFEQGQANSTRTSRIVNQQNWYGSEHLKKVQKTLTKKKAPTMIVSKLKIAELLQDLKAQEYKDKKINKANTASSVTQKDSTSLCTIRNLRSKYSSKVL